MQLTNCHVHLRKHGCSLATPLAGCVDELASSIERAPRDFCSGGTRDVVSDARGFGV